MAKILRCGDVMPGCSFVAEGKDVAEVMAKGAQHAKTAASSQPRNGRIRISFSRLNPGAKSDTKRQPTPQLSGLDSIWHLVDRDTARARRHPYGCSARYGKLGAVPGGGARALRRRHERSGQQCSNALGGRLQGHGNSLPAGDNAAPGEVRLLWPSRVALTHRRARGQRDDAPVSCRIGPQTYLVHAPR